MAFELRQSMILTQQLVMTPQLQMAIKLLQLTRLELVEEINEEMEENPTLEEQLEGDSNDDSRTDGDSDPIEHESPEASEITAEESVRDDFDWENYLYEYSSDRTSAPYEERNTPAIGNIETEGLDLCQSVRFLSQWLAIEMD